MGKELERRRLWARLLTLMEFYRFYLMPLLYHFKASETYVEHGFYLKQAPHILHELFTLKKVQSQQPTSGRIGVIYAPPLRNHQA